MGLGGQDSRKRFYGNPEVATDKGIYADSQALLVNGAITVKEGRVVLTKAGILAATMAAPTAGTDDGNIVEITSAGAHAHVITFASGKINGGTLVTATFGGAIGDSIRLMAHNGVWLTCGAPRNVTIA